MIAAFKVFGNQNGCNNIYLKASFSDPCENVTCSITGEVCDGGVCKCGESSSCTDNEKVNYCDFENSQCKCAENVDACLSQQLCIHERCEGI